MGRAETALWWATVTAMPTSDQSLAQAIRPAGTNEGTPPRMAGVAHQAQTMKGIMVRGKLRGNGPVDVTIRGGGQSLTYQAHAPGPFATVITLPHVGTHAIQVSVRDAQGRVGTASGNVRRLR